MNRKKGTKSATDELLDVLEVLEKEGIKVKDIQISKKRQGEKQVFVKLKEVPGIETILKKYEMFDNISPDFPLGRRIHTMKTRKNSLTQSQLDRGKALGLFIDKVDEFLEIVKLLQEAKINTDAVPESRFINKKVVFIKLRDIKGAEELIKQEKVDADYPYGRMLKSVRLKGRAGSKLTPEQQEKAENLGVLNHCKSEKNTLNCTQPLSAIQETLRVLEILSKNGYDISTLTISIRDEDGKYKPKILKDIDGIEKLAKEHNIPLDFPIGQRIIYIRGILTGSKKDIHMSDEEKKRAIEIGINRRLARIDETLRKNIKLKSRVVEETLRVVRILSENEVYASSIKEKIRIGTRSVWTKINDIPRILPIINKYHLDGDFDIGRGLHRIRTSAKNGNLDEETIIEALELGIITKLQGLAIEKANAELQNRKAEELHLKYDELYNMVINRGKEFDGHGNI